MVLYIPHISLYMHMKKYSPRESYRKAVVRVVRGPQKCEVCPYFDFLRIILNNKKY